MADLFDQLIEPLLAREGGYVNDPKDKGGETNWGVTFDVARRNGYFGPMRELSRDQAKAIYRSEYWTRPGLHLIAPVSAEVAEEVFDSGVNLGVGVASRWLQRALNALNREEADYPDVLVDGAIGAQTAKALQSLIIKRGPSGEGVLMKALNCLQGARYIELCEAREANERFAFGWLQQRVGL